MIYAQKSSSMQVTSDSNSNEYIYIYWYINVYVYAFLFRKKAWIMVEQEHMYDCSELVHVCLPDKSKHLFCSTRMHVMCRARMNVFVGRRHAWLLNSDTLRLAWKCHRLAQQKPRKMNGFEVHTSRLHCTNNHYGHSLRCAFKSLTSDIQL